MKYDVIGEKYRLVEKFEKGDIGNFLPIKYVVLLSRCLIRENVDMKTAVRLVKEFEKPNFEVRIIEHPKGVELVKKFRK